MFCYHNQLLPRTFHNLFVTSQVHSSNTTTATSYRPHSYRTNLKQFTILYLGPKTWKSLPTRITGSPSVPTFKKRMNKF